MFVCRLSFVTRKYYTADLHQILCMSPMVVAGFCSDVVPVRYVFPVVWMTSYFHLMVRWCVTCIYGDRTQQASVIST